MLEIFEDVRNHLLIAKHGLVTDASGLTILAAIDDGLKVVRATLTKTKE
jgi:hypothetical protein